MKKVLILLMVFGLSSLAHAGLSWSQSSVAVDVDGLVLVYIESDTTAAIDQTWTGASGSTIAEVVAINALPAAGDNAVVVDYRGSYAGWWTVETKDTAEPFNIATGNQYEVTIKGLAVGSDTLYVGSDAITVTVPEPMTIALLGLGGLLLRRRR